MRKTERERPAREAGQPGRPAAARGPSASILALQRSAGNAAVARILTRPVLQRDGWHEARQGSWNEKSYAVAGTLRVVLDGLSIGFQEADVIKGKGAPTTELAGEKGSARAIVVVPDGTDLAGGKLEVLLLYHGLGTTAGIAYREKSTTDKEGIGAEGTVHDVENDLVEQQLSASRRNMIAILPQGKSTGQSGRFQIPNPQAYVTEVLKKLKAELATLQPKVSVPDPLVPYRIVSAGHSGGGPYAVSTADALQGGDWARTSPLFLFDAINGPNELRGLRAVLKTWLEEDERHLLAAKDPDAELVKRGIKFRSTYSQDSDEVYLKHHEGGTYKRWGKTITISDKDPDNMSLNGWLAQWFGAHAKGKLGGAVGQRWRSQYVTEKVSGSHHHQIGTGKAASASERDATPKGVTGPSQKAGVPRYDPATPGNLDKALRGLPTDARRPGGQGAHAMLEEDPDWVYV